MPLRVGIDIVNVASVRESLATHGDRYLERVYTKREIADCRTAGEISVTRLAARFAAKEAAMKALRLSPEQGLDWRSIELVRDATGWTELRLSGKAAELAAEAGIVELAVSVTHEESVAAAVVVANVDQP